MRALIFSPQMEATVCIILHTILATHAVLKIGENNKDILQFQLRNIQLCDAFRLVTRERKYLMIYKYRAKKCYIAYHLNLGCFQLYQNFQLIVLKSISFCCRYSSLWSAESKRQALFIPRNTKGAWKRDFKLSTQFRFRFVQLFYLFIYLFIYFKYGFLNKCVVNMAEYR